jgi:hypothetical protein
VTTSPRNITRDMHLGALRSAPESLSAPEGIGSSLATGLSAVSQGA